MVGAVLHTSSSVSSYQLLAAFILNWGNGGKQSNLVQITMDKFQEDGLLVYFFSFFFFRSLNFFERFLILFLSGCTFLRRDRMLDAGNHVAQQTSLRTHRLMDQCDVVPKVGKALHWRVAASMSSTIWITREGQQDLFSAVLDCWKSHLSHGTGSLWPSSALLPLCRAVHLREQELQLFPMLDLAPSIQPWENEL